MLLRANCNFYDVAMGHLAAGEIFEEPRVKVANQLIRRGTASPHFYEVKIIRPEVQATAAPFRLSDHADDGSAVEVPAACDPLLARADAPVDGVGDYRRRRRGRPRKHPK